MLHRTMSRHVKCDMKCHALKITKSPYPNKFENRHDYVNHKATKTLKCIATFAIQAIEDKIVEASYSNRVTTENKRIHTSPPHSKLGCLFFSIGTSNCGTRLHRGNGGGNALFSPLEVGKASEGPFMVKCHN